MLRKIVNSYDGMSLQVKATIWFLVCSVLQRGISVITTPIFTRLLSAEEYGQFSVFNSWLSVITVIVTLQLSAGVYTMSIVKFKEENKVFSSSMQGLTLTLCFIWTVVYLIFHDFWNSLFSLTTVQMLAMMLMIWSSSAFNFWMTMQRNQYRYRALVIITLLVSIAKPLIGILLVMHAEDKVTARIIGLMLVEVFAYSFAFAVQMQQGKKFFDFKFWKYAIMFNFPLIPHYLANTVLISSDRIMIQNIEGDMAAGIYSLAYSISLVMCMVNEALGKTMNPWLYQKMNSKEYHHMSKVVYPSLGIIAIANLSLIAVAPELVAIFAPKEYYAAIYVIPPVSMSMYFTYMYLCFAPFEFYYEKRMWTTVATLISAVLNIVMNAILIPRFGYVVAGYTTLICYVLNALAHYYFMKKVCRDYADDAKPYNPNVLLGMSIAFLGMGFIYIPMYNNMWIRYGFTIMLLVVLFIKRKKILFIARMVGKEFKK